MIGRKLYIVWHQDSPGTRVVVVRRFRPRSPFSRVGELHVATYYPVMTAPVLAEPAADLTEVEL